jgi:signal transduction histidine kinase
VQVALDLDPSMPPLELDADQFQQVFHNLLRNAYQAIPGKGGRIDIRSRATDYEVELSIADNGTGISPESMGALFEPFHSTKESGTGLGLLIVRRIVREHGGEIELHGEQGLGTRVTIHLPRARRDARLLADAAAPLIDVEAN